MRRLVLGALVVAGCAETPRAQDLPSLPDPHSAVGGYALIPDQEVHVPPEPKPKLVQAPASAPPEVIVGPFDDSGEPAPDGTAFCPFTISGKGFPAVRRDGSKVVTLVDEVLGPSPDVDHVVEVRITDLATDVLDDATVVLDAEQFEGDEHCRKLWLAARRRASVLNRALAESDWLSLRRVDVREWDRHHGEDDGGRFDVPPNVRPAELLWREGELLVSIPDVEVLARVRRDWTSPEVDTDIAELYVEPTLGLAVASVQQLDATCSCFSWTRHRPWPIGTKSAEQLLARNSFRPAPKRE
ncbi:MAG: hypothetical protein AAF721_04485 [Myxococcota bacterium]